MTRRPVYPEPIRGRANHGPRQIGNHGRMRNGSGVSVGATGVGYRNMFGCVGAWYCGAATDVIGCGPIGSVMTLPVMVNATEPAGPLAVTRSVYCPGARSAVCPVTVSPVWPVSVKTVRPPASMMANWTLAPTGPVADRASPNAWLRPTKSVE